MKSLLSILAILLLAGVGCETNSQPTAYEIQKDERQDIVDSCLERGGIPIFSYWDESLLKDCKFPPTEQRTEGKLSK